MTSHLLPIYARVDLAFERGERVGIKNDGGGALQNCGDQILRSAPDAASRPDDNRVESLIRQKVSESAYSGMAVNWDQIMASQLDLQPKAFDYKLQMTPPALPEPGTYKLV